MPTPLPNKMPTPLPNNLIFTAPRTTTDLLELGFACVGAVAKFGKEGEADAIAIPLAKAKDLVVEYIPEQEQQFIGLRDQLNHLELTPNRKQFLLYQVYCLAAWAINAREHEADKQRQDIESLKGAGLGGIV